MNATLLTALVSLLSSVAASAVSATVAYRIAMRTTRTQQQATDESVREKNIERLVRLQVAFARWHDALVDFARELEYQGVDLGRFQTMISEVRHEARSAQASTLHFEVSCESPSWDMLDLATDMVFRAIKGDTFDKNEFAQCVGDFDLFFDRVCATMRTRLAYRDKWQAPAIPQFIRVSAPPSEADIMAEEHAGASSRVLSALERGRPVALRADSPTQLGDAWGQDDVDRVTHVTLERPDFDLVVCGTKTVEVALRPNPLYWSLVGLVGGQRLCFTCDGNECLTTIVRVAQYSTVKELIAAETMAKSHADLLLHMFPSEWRSVAVEFKLASPGSAEKPCLIPG